MRVMGLGAALRERWVPDQHITTYCVHGPQGALDRSPRLRKDLLAAVQGQGYRVLHSVRIADCDMPGHQRLTSEVLALVPLRLQGYPCGWYPTRGGIRVYQTLQRALSPEEYEISVRRWLPELQAVLGAPLVVDLACQDWTRMFRCPRVVRDGVNYWETPIYSEALTPVDPGDCTPPPPPPKVWSPPVIHRAADQHTRYGAKALHNQCAKLREAKAGEGHLTLTRAAFSIGQLIAGGELQEHGALEDLEGAIQGWDLTPQQFAVRLRTLKDCVEAGRKHPLQAPNKSGRPDLDHLRKWLADKTREPIRVPDLTVDCFGLEEI